MPRVLIVEDSPVAREFLFAVLESDPHIKVVGTATNGLEAIEAVKRYKPDVVTMDVHMPLMDGLEATRRIMETYPLPIVIVSASLDAEEVKTSFKAMEAGAVAAVQRPQGIGYPECGTMVKDLIQTVKLMSEVKVVKRWSRNVKTEGAAVPIPELSEEQKAQDVKIVAIGASTGGPPVIRTILAGLPKNFPVPVLIVQHIVHGFTQGFTEWLNQSSGFPVQEAVHGALFLPGHAYVAPDGRQMGVTKTNRVTLNTDEPENGLRPSVSYLFRSAMDAYGPHAIGVLLTGMGKDGAEELKLMKDAGAFTIAQDQESCAVFGMPGEAVRFGGACYVLKPEQVANMLTELVMKIKRKQQ